MIALYLPGKSEPAFVFQLKHVKVIHVLVYRIITSYNNTGGIAELHIGGLQSLL